MGRTRRRGGSRSAQFRSWGWLLAACAALAIYSHSWRTALYLALMWLVYVVFLQLAMCRVETRKHQPCKWLVRGLIGTCKYHVGSKRGLPRLVRGPRYVGLPRLMWPRDDFDGLVAVRAEPQPKPGRAVTAKASQPRYDRLNVLIAVGAFLVTAVGVIRDFVAG
ncbi:hypothetical protein AB0I34_37765 [Kribbella sp. NPDC050281]|uniref:hypothetical protein n=1 Tax=Kribbella sp. NPDC050281 TaxID=3155515 RepID=UPI00340B9D25